MTEINIPGDELTTASNNMQQVLQLFNSSNTSVPNLDTALGTSDKLVSGTAQNFDKRWNDGRTQLAQEGQQIIDAMNKIVSTFTDTDNQLAANLSPNSGGSSGSSS
jgi:hypothetical protein